MKSCNLKLHIRHITRCSVNFDECYFFVVETKFLHASFSPQKRKKKLRAETQKFLEILQPKDGQFHI